MLIGGGCGGRCGALVDQFGGGRCGVQVDQFGEGGGKAGIGSKDHKSNNGTTKARRYRF